MNEAPESIGRCQGARAGFHSGEGDRRAPDACPTYREARSMSGTTPARMLAERFGDVDAMRALYAPDVTWTISASLGVPTLEGYDAVVAFNRQVWTEHHRPDCTVAILDEI